MENMNGDGKMCKCPHHRALPWAGFFIGVLFFFQALGVLSSGFVALVWPLLLIAGTGSKLGMCRCC